MIDMQRNKNDKKADIDQLNSFLRGELSAVATYKQCMEKVEDAALLAQLRHLKASHQDRVATLSVRIRNLGGTPEEESGVWGNFAKALEGGATLFGPKAAISMLEEGEDHGLAAYRRNVNALSPDMQSFVSTVLIPEQKKTHDTLSQIQLPAS